MSEVWSARSRSRLCLYLLSYWVWAGLQGPAVRRERLSQRRTTVCPPPPWTSPPPPSRPHVKVAFTRSVRRCLRWPSSEVGWHVMSPPGCHSHCCRSAVRPVRGGAVCSLLHLPWRGAGVRHLSVRRLYTGGSTCSSSTSRLTCSLDLLSPGPGVRRGHLLGATALCWGAVTHRKAQPRVLSDLLQCHHFQPPKTCLNAAVGYDLQRTTFDHGNRVRPPPSPCLSDCQHVNYLCLEFWADK